MLTRANKQSWLWAILLLTGLSWTANDALADDFEPTLPVYRMTIDPADLARLEEDPFSNETYPAVIEFQSVDYHAQVRFRGRTSRNLPKRSWNVKFEDHGPRSWESTNLNAEYRDRSLIRNRLSMILGEKIGLDSPEGFFVSLFVNDEYAGVYHEIEDIDEAFFERRSFPEPDLLLQAIRHSARFTPLLYEDDFEDAYEIKEAHGGMLEQFHIDCMFFLNASTSLFREQINQQIDISNILSFFALQNAITNFDGINKNYYFAQHADRLYRIYPWDCDASFGVDWRGDWKIDYGTLGHIGSLSSNVLFSRLMAIPEYHTSFLLMLHNIGDHRFSQLAPIIDSLYALIEHDVLADPFKVGSNAEFLAERDSLHIYLQRKGNVLRDIEGFQNPVPGKVQTSHAYLDSSGESILFEMTSSQPLHYARLYLIHTDADTLDYHLFSMRDDGSLGDPVAGDGIYSRVADLSDYGTPMYYVGEGRLQGDLLFPSPACGSLYWANYLSSLPSIRSSVYAPTPQSVGITQMIDGGPGGTHLVVLRNESEEILDLNGSYVQLDSSYLLLRFEGLPLLDPGDEFILPENRAHVQTQLDAPLAPSSFYGLAQPADSLFLFDAGGQRITAKKVEFDTQVEETGRVVVNEINYHSANSYDTGDWVELFARGGSVNLSGWSLLDSEDDHRYEFPDLTLMPQNSFLIVAEDPDRFRAVTGFEGELLGGFDYSFGNGGDRVRLFDDSQLLVDIVDYLDAAPWPDQPDGSGATLELMHPDSANFGYRFWGASLENSPYGTPGRLNSVFPDTVDPPPPPPLPTLPSRWGIEKIYPNPFNSQVTILLAAPEAGYFQIDVYNVLGQQVGTIEHSVLQPGIVPIFWDGSFAKAPLASGLYILVAKEPVNLPAKRLLLLR
ncbi:CotH kinase family protein [bacterium]|nr:CotH kinase family protein [bacterium]